MIRGFRPAAIIFDMDGVLLLSSGIHEAAYRQVLQPFHLADFQYARYAGMRTPDALAEIASEHRLRLSAAQIQTLAAEKSRIALESIQRENPIAPDCRHVLGRLSGEFQLALASSASAATVNAFVDRNYLRQFFECILSGADVLEAKPSPEIYRLTCERLGLPPAKCLVVEDAVSGIQAARAAGAIACGVAGTHVRERLEAAGADFVVEDIRELLQLAMN